MRSARFTPWSAEASAAGFFDPTWWPLPAFLPVPAPSTGALFTRAAGPDPVWLRVRAEQNAREEPEFFRRSLGAPALQSEVLGRATRIELYAAASDAAAAAARGGASHQKPVTEVVSLLAGRRTSALKEAVATYRSFAAAERILHTSYSLVTGWSALTAVLTHGASLPEEDRLIDARPGRDTLANLLVGMHFDASAPWREGIDGIRPTHHDMLGFAAAAGPRPRYAIDVDVEVPWQGVERFIWAAVNDSRSRWQRAWADVPPELSASPFGALRAAETLIAAAPWVDQLTGASLFAKAAARRIGPEMTALVRALPDPAAQSALIPAMKALGACVGEGLVRTAASTPPRVVLPALARVRHHRSVPGAVLS